MHLTTHVVVAAAVGAVLQNRIDLTAPIAVAAGMATHAALDVLPHREGTALATAVLDGLIATASVALILVRLGAPCFWFALGASFPDLEIAVHRLGLSAWPYLFPSHSGQLTHGQSLSIAGDLLQPALVILSLITLRVILLS